MQTTSKILSTAALTISLIAPTATVTAHAEIRSESAATASGGAQIHSSPATRALQVKGGIASRYSSLGGARAFGNPVTAERAVAGGVVQSFRASSGKVTDFYWKSGVGANPVSGGIKSAFDRLGGAARVGYPVSAERSVAGGRVQSFRSSAGKSTDIYWKSGIGTYSVSGGIKSSFDRLGGAARVGHPTSTERAVASGVTQSFRTSGGKVTDVYWSSETGAHPVSGGIRSELNRVGGVSKTGFPTQKESALSGGKVSQSFEKGVMQWLTGGRGATFYPHVSSSGAAPVGTAETVRTGLITGYTYHSTDGSTAIAHSSKWNSKTIHTAVGGIGTYDDPITLATDPKIYKPGTRFYLPHVNRYFIVEDTCGACGGKHDRIDMWLGGEKSDKESDTLKCAYAVTGDYKFIVNPKRGYTVTPGSIFNSKTDTCTKITP